METLIVETLTKIKPKDPLRWVKQSVWRKRNWSDSYLGIWFFDRRTTSLRSDTSYGRKSTKSHRGRTRNTTIESRLSCTIGRGPVKHSTVQDSVYHPGMCTPPRLVPVRKILFFFNFFFFLLSVCQHLEGRTGRTKARFSAIWDKNERKVELRKSIK
jgi:hypothetical protein